MRLKPTNHLFLLIVCCTMGMTIAATAQEDKTQAEIEAAAKESARNEPDPLISSESESRIKPNTAPPLLKEVSKDSVQQIKTVKAVKPAEKNTPVEKNAKEEDPLSFNFLYYIIEKFKLSDMIE